ncbi:hypothetical protein CRUP_026975 [Coryphaenoides rupestris]|nr:hypothetical protein CRUP_026975 [Coryphaenoides rupestris]
MDADVERTEPADSDQDEEEDVYEVERIIDMRVEEKSPTKLDTVSMDSDSDKDRPSDMPIKKKKKKKLTSKDEEPPLKEKGRKKKDKKREEITKPLPAPETDEEEEEEEEEEDAQPLTPPSPPPSQHREKPTEKKKRVVDSDEEEEELAPSKKHRKGKEAGKHRKEKASEEGRKKKGKKERKVESSDDEDAAPLEEDLSDAPSGRSEEKARQQQKKGQRSETKSQGFKDHHVKKPRKSEGSLQKAKGQSFSRLRAEDPAPHSSDSSDSSSLHKKARSKTTPEGTAPLPPAAKIPPSSSSSSSSSSLALTGIGTKAREEEMEVVAAVAAGGKEGEPTPGGQKDSSTNLFEKFLLNCEAKDRVPRRHAVHQPPVATETTSTTSSGSSSTGKPKLIGKIEKKGKSKDSPVQKPDSDKMAAKQTEAATPRASQSHGFSLDSDEKEVEELSVRARAGEERRDKAAEEAGQRPGWERRTPTDDRRWKRREDTDPRLFMACDDTPEPPDPLEGADKSRGQATLNLGMGMDLKLDWMTLEDFQKHLNGEDEILSGPPLSPSELRDAVKSGDYMSVKLALNSKEEYNLDQEVSSTAHVTSPHPASV